MSRPVVARVGGGLRRLLGAPGLWLGAWFGLAVIAKTVGIHVSVVLTAELHPYLALDLRRVVFSTFDLVRHHPGVLAEVQASVIASGIVGAVAWMLLSPLVVARLAGRRPWAELGGRAVSKLPAVVVQSLWHLVLRAVLLLLTLMAIPERIVWFVLPLVWLAAGVALDATRVAVVEHDAAPWHVRTAWRGLVGVVRRPGTLLPCMVLGLGQLVITAVIVWVALLGYGQASLWPARLLTLLSVGLGLWRIGIVVEDAASDPPAAG